MRLGIKLGFFSMCTAAFVGGTAGCGGYDVGASGDMVGAGAGEFGATQGGVQDMGLARELVANGRVPPPEAFVVEGMFSEHDLPLDGPRCTTLLCLRGALGVAPTLDGTASGWMQVGLSSTIDPETYERPSVTLVATVDVSGSMGWNYGDGAYPTPGSVSRELLHRIADELGPQDRVAVVTYGSDSRVELGLTAGDDPAIARTIDALDENGSTNMEAGLRVAYGLAEDALDGGTEEVRLVLFTDVQPNVGATGATDFERMAATNAENGIGLTVMAVGVGLGQEVLNAMSHLRGGNAFSLFDLEDVDELMADSWPWMVSPIAYDLSVELTPPEGFEVVDAYGFPEGTGGESAGFDVSTVFLSRRKGALLLRLEQTGDVPDDLEHVRVDGTLSYETPGGQTVGDTISATYSGEPLDDRGQYFQQPSVGKTVALAILVSGMRDAAEAYGSDQESAVELMRTVSDRFSADAAVLGDPALDPEVQLAADLLELMEEGAEQGNLYGEYY